MATRKFWKKSELREEALKYDTKTAFKQGNTNAYQAAWRHGLLDELCAHMTRPDPCFKWSLEDLKREARKYATRKEFVQHAANAYNSASRRSLLNLVCAHMTTYRNKPI